MIFKQLTHTSIRIFVDGEKSAKFNDHMLETSDEETAQMLRGRDDVVEMDVEEPEQEEKVQEEPGEQPKPAPKRKARKTKENNEV